jgi:hypothetical protein
MQPPLKSWTGSLTVVRRKFAFPRSDAFDASSRDLDVGDDLRARMRASSCIHSGRHWLRVVRSLELCWWHHANLSVQTSPVEPVDVGERLEFDIDEAAPRAALVDQFGLVQAVEGLGQGILVAVFSGSSRIILAWSARDRIGVGTGDSAQGGDLN